MKILIVGAGIAGLAVASLLERTDWQVHIVERVERFDRVGYGLGLWRNGSVILEDLELLEPLGRRAEAVKEWEMRRADGTLLNTYEVGIGDGIPDLLTLHRADLHEVLHGSLESSSVQMDTTVERLDVQPGDDGVDVEFSNGEAGRFDLVVGADGIGSTVRELAFDGWTVEQLDTASFALWVPENMEFDHPVEWLGPKGATLLVAPVRNRAMANFAMPLHNGMQLDDPLAVLREHTRGFGWVVPELLEAIPEDADVFATRNRQVHAPRWHSERVVLVGDAAHALHPIVGMGATLALEDARLLYELLSDKAPEHVDVALRRWEARRRKRLRRFRRLATVARKVLLTRSRLVASMRNFALKHSSSLMELFVSDTDPVGRDRRTPP